MLPVLKTLLDSAILWIYAQTIWDVAVSGLYYFSVPWIVWGSITIVSSLRFLKNPPSDPKIVQEVLGTDPYNTERDSLISDDQGNRKQYCMRVVAHRGGGYDYPENSLSAFRNVKYLTTH